MSFWDSIKPATRAPVATAVDLQADQKTVKVAWSDGVATEVSARALRQYCPCAECVEEWSGRRTYDVATIPAELKVLELAPVGNYAVTFTFGDLHRTGIYNWEYLRQLSTHGAAPA
ncbi:MAG: DUF971 domain-containing protein [Archangium sp.]|nr:DUF971 domain-containing protein [Archangium sp.]